MGTTVTGKLGRDASQFQAGDATGFGVRIGVKYYDRETRQNEWTNYEAAIFSKNPAQIQFYQSSLVEGSVVEITGDSIKIKEYNGKYTLELLNAKIGFIHTGQQAPQQASNPHPRQHPPQPRQSPQRAPTPPPGAPANYNPQGANTPTPAMDNFDDAPPF